MAFILAAAEFIFDFFYKPTIMYYVSCCLFIRCKPHCSSVNQDGMSYYSTRCIFSPLVHRWYLYNTPVL